MPIVRQDGGRPGRDRLVAAAAASTTGADRDGQALHDTAAGADGGPLAGEHAVVAGEVAADHEGFHSGAVAGQRFALVRHVRRVLSVVDPDFAVVPVTVAVRLVEGIGPLTACADTYDCVSFSGGASGS